MEIRKRTFSGLRSREETEREVRNRAVALRAAEEGIVLLKNEGVLPVDKSRPLALFGSGASNTIKGGTGSGDVNERRSLSVYDGMKEWGYSICNIPWLKEYQETYQKARLDWKKEILDEDAKPEPHTFFDVYAEHPFAIPAPRRMTKEDLGDAKVAIYVISRISGEGADRREEPGDYYLSEEERADLHALADLCDTIIVLLNSGAQMDLEELLAIPQIKGLVHISQAGMEGGLAVAKVLCGDSTPSGKLADTWAKRYSDFPGADAFSYRDGNTEKEVYREGIFVGYRYFDAFSKEIRYPFGFGLSYTDFQITPTKGAVNGNTLTFACQVKNIGDTYPGKEVVQLYVSAPGDSAKEVKKLIAYQKTKSLEPGEAQELLIEADGKALAYFQPEKGAWMLDAGEYQILIGNSSKDLKPAWRILVEEETILEAVERICPVRDKLEEEMPDPGVRKDLRMRWKRELDNQNEAPLTLCAKREKKASWPRSPYEEKARKIVEQLTDEQLTAMAVGEISKGHDVAFGSTGIMVPGAAGETSSSLEESHGIPGVSMADGPAGLRVIQQYQADEESRSVYTEGIKGALENGLFLNREENKYPNAATFYQFCTAFPVGAMLSQTWNTSLIREVGAAVGEEMEELGISWWLAPGMNIHRNPLCGRNFEYFSEDPVLAGTIAAAMTQGVQSLPGIGTTIKHFTCNNLECNRMGSDSIVSERALREIYLRGFEIAVKTSQPMAVMSSYNLVNGVHTANSKDLLTKVLREEWGFRGFVMSDWTTTGEKGGSSPWKCIAAGNDLIMPGEEGDIKGILGAVADGDLTREELENGIVRLLTVIFQTNAYKNSVSYSKQFQKEELDL